MQRKQKPRHGTLSPFIKPNPVVDDSFIHSSIPMHLKHRNCRQAFIPFMARPPPGLMLALIVVPLLLFLRPFLAVASEQGEGQRPPPNFVVVFLDDAGWGDLGANWPETPETTVLDQLARQSLRCVQYVPCPVKSYGLDQSRTDSNMPPKHKTVSLTSTLPPRSAHRAAPASSRAASGCARA